MPHFALEDIKNITSWYRLDLIIFHRSTFPQFVNTLINQIPLVLNSLGVLLVALIFLPITYTAIKNRSIKSSRITLIEGIVIPISISVLVFIPIYLIAIHPFEEPLMIMEVENKILTPLYTFLGILFIAIIFRVIFTTPEIKKNDVVLKETSTANNLSPPPKSADITNNKLIQDNLPTFLIKEYECSQKMHNYYGKLIWEIGGILIGGGLAFVGIVVSRSIEFHPTYSVSLAAIVFTILMSTFFLSLRRWREIAEIHLNRCREIEGIFSLYGQHQQVKDANKLEGLKIEGLEKPIVAPKPSGWASIKILITSLIIVVWIIAAYFALF